MTGAAETGHPWFAHASDRCTSEPAGHCRSLAVEPMRAAAATKQPDPHRAMRSLARVDAERVLSLDSRSDQALNGEATSAPDAGCLMRTPA